MQRKARRSRWQSTSAAASGGTGHLEREPIRESTKQTNKRVAEKIESAHKTRLAMGEVGIRDRVAAPTLKQFAERDFTPFIETRCQSKPKTLGTTKNGIRV